MTVPDKSANTRLQRALKYLQMAQTSRELPYAVIPYVRAAEFLIQAALDEGKPAGKPDVQD